LRLWFARLLWLTLGGVLRRTLIAALLRRFAFAT
jgi:hypothetical protein